VDSGVPTKARQRILHIGCGGEKLPPWLGAVEEVRLDIEARNQPDIVADMLDMGEIGEFEGVFTSHCLEHVYPHQVPVALAEFKRVLVSGGIAIIVVPDLEDVKPTDEALYESPAGPICGLDMIYGHRASIEAYPHMAHHTGFTSETMRAALAAAGFVNIKTARIPSFNLLATGAKP
jgi:hypothetical protein